MLSERSACKAPISVGMVPESNELDSMANAGHSGPSSHLIASKWLLELAYSKYPPRTLSAQRATEELRVVRERGHETGETAWAASNVLLL